LRWSAAIPAERSSQLLTSGLGWRNFNGELLRRKIRMAANLQNEEHRRIFSGNETGGEARMTPGRRKREF